MDPYIRIYVMLNIFIHAHVHQIIMYLSNSLYLFQINSFVMCQSQSEMHLHCQERTYFLTVRLNAKPRMIQNYAVYLLIFEVFPSLRASFVAIAIQEG